MIHAISDHILDFFQHAVIDKLDFWLVFGLLAQLVFASRFLVQWISSERAGRVVIPRSFWILSLVGSTMTIAYGIARAELPVIIGQFAWIIYIRNLILLERERAALRSGHADAPEPDAPPARLNP